MSFSLIEIDPVHRIYSGHFSSFPEDIAVHGVSCRRGGVSRFERHLVNELDAILCLIGAVGGKGQDGIAHIGNIVNHAAFIRIRQNLVDKVDS